MISVIIPVYNCEQYVSKSIDSALSQTFKDYEIIVVDDGSTDGTLYEIGKYSDRCKIIHKNNGGTASALNAGIKEAKGEWIKWLSADDELYPNALQVLNSAVEFCVNPKNRIFYTQYHVIDKDGKVQYTYTEPNRNNWSQDQRLEFFKSGYYVNMSSSLIHKSIFDLVGMFDESLPCCEDLDFMIRAIKHGIIPTLMDDIILKYRIHPGQLTNRVNPIWHDIIVRKNYD